MKELGQTQVRFHSQCSQKVGEGYKGKNTDLESEECSVNLICASTDSVTPGDLVSDRSSPVNWGTGQHLKKNYISGGEAQTGEMISNLLSLTAHWLGRLTCVSVCTWMILMRRKRKDICVGTWDM